jgi:hypothetical protein
VLEQVEQHSLSHPIRHGARVSLPNEDDSTRYLWDVLELDQAHPY